MSALLVAWRTESSHLLALGVRSCCSFLVFLILDSWSPKEAPQADPYPGS